MLPPDDDKVTYLGRTTFRNEFKLFGIRRRDRRHHMYLIGKTGTGKSTLLETMIRQDIENGEGCALIDPHGDLVERIRATIPEHRKGDLVYLNPADPAFALAYNPLDRVAPEKVALATSGLLSVFKKIWIDCWGPRLEHILRNALLTLFEQPSATMADVLKLLNDKTFRQIALHCVSNDLVRDFWLKEYEKYPDRFRIEAIAPIQNKVGAFLSNPLLQRILCQPKSAFNLRVIIDTGKIFLVNLAKGTIGEDTTALMGALLVSGLGLAALSRSDTDTENRRDFFLYLDEFQSFTTESLGTMLSELRKYRLSLVLAHQFLSQLELPIRDAILGNVGSMLVFRVGPADAELLEPEFDPDISIEDLVNLPNYNVYLKLMIDGAVSRAFSAETAVFP